MRISDWSSDVCSSDLVIINPQGPDERSIDRILERRNLLYRSDDMRTKQFAANVDQLLVVVAPEPAFSDDLLGRALVAAQSADIVPIVILNKTDLQANLPRARERLAKLAQADVRVIELSALAPQALRETLLPILQGQCSLLRGQSKTKGQ